LSTAPGHHLLVELGEQVRALLLRDAGDQASGQGADRVLALAGDQHLHHRLLLFVQRLVGLDLLLGQTLVEVHLDAGDPQVVLGQVGQVVLDRDVVPLASALAVAAEPVDDLLDQPGPPAALAADAAVGPVVDLVRRVLAGGLHLVGVALALSLGVGGELARLVLALPVGLVQPHLGRGVEQVPRLGGVGDDRVAVGLGLDPELEVDLLVVDLGGGGERLHLLPGLGPDVGLALLGGALVLGAPVLDDRVVVGLVLLGLLADLDRIDAALGRRRLLVGPALHVLEEVADGAANLLAVGLDLLD
jgi:hypothetical protein